MTAQRGRPTRPGVSQATLPNRARATATVGRATVPSARRSTDTPAPETLRRSEAETLRRNAATAARDYPVDGSAALAVVPEEVDFDDLGPVRSRTVEEREAADARAAQRAADRAAGRSATESRRRLLVAPPLPVNVARAPFVAMLIGIVVVGVVGILVLTTMINANQFRLNDLQNKQAGLNQTEQQLQQNLAQQESPGSLVAAAHKLGLVPAGTLAYIQMPDGSVVGVPQPAAKTPSVTAQTGSSSSNSPKASTGTATGKPSTGATAAGH
jgi:type II secretory pathway pseudopilin PulG